MCNMKVSENLFMVSDDLYVGYKLGWQINFYSRNTDRNLPYGLRILSLPKFI